MTNITEERPATILDAIADADSSMPVVGEVVLEVDYQIIEHFSEHLYDSPNKAVEELVANSFDAFATTVRVFTPGPYTTNRVIVWDDGESMDIEGLKQLWWIAKSPKMNGDRQSESDGRTRKIIGKFGIGKLASYSVGGVISHICRCRGQFYLVCIDYARISGESGQPPVSSSKPMRAPVIGLTEAKARELLTSLFDAPPPSLSAMLDSESWTFATIENLKIDDLPTGRLKWVLGNGMPLRPDFHISVNEQNVQSRLEKRCAIEWDFGADEVTSIVRQRWEDATRAGTVASDLEFGRERGLNQAVPEDEIPYIRFPTLGLVWGRVRLFDETLLSHRSADAGRSHGFFLLVRGRLLNPDDEKLFLPDPSFQTFYRSQYVIHADGLDGELLADRQRLRRQEPSKELEIFQRALAGIARTTVEARDEQREEAHSTQAILPIGSRSYYRDPINALLLRAPIEETHDFDPAAITVDRKPLGERETIARLSLDENSFHVNTLHPYYSALERRAGKSRAAREFRRAFDLFAISERLLEGHLLNIGIDEDEVLEVVEWRDGLLRKMASAYDADSETIGEMFRASFVGGREFEMALDRVFREMGFTSKRDGRPGKQDILVVATVGPESYDFVVEAAGSQGNVGNEAAGVSAAANHRCQVRAGHALIVARRFVGFEMDRSNEKAAVFRECQATGGVSIMEVAAIKKVHRAMSRFAYPLAVLRDVFTTLETPEEKMTRIEGLVQPTKGFDYADLLGRIWEKQGGAASGDVVAYRSVFQDGPWKSDGMEFSDFQRRLVALETLAAGRIALDTSREHAYLRQAPELILDQMELALRGEGHDVEGQNTE